MSRTAAQVTVEIGAAFAGNFKSVFGSANAELGKIGGAVQKLESRQKELNAVIKEQERLGAKGSPLKALYAQQELDQITQKLGKLRGEQEKIIQQQARMRALGDSLRGVRGAAREVGGQLKSLTAQVAVAGAGLGYFFKKNFIDSAAQFEKFKTILETTEGSAEKASKAMQWVSDFAAKTPFELAEVTDAFVKLRAYGLDPTNGLLKTLGDTGAAMGKPVMQAVEAIADAVTGENERLKEFGIKGSKKGGQVTYEYTDKAGKQQTKTIDANNRKLIESTLVAIWNEKYGGAMDKLSKTWGGMTSNVGDQWTRFTTMVMDSGPFEMLKSRLSELLGTIDQMAADGRLKAYAEQTGKALTEFAKGAWEVGSAIVSVTRWLADFVGGWKNLAIGLALIKLAPLIWGIGKLGFAITVAAGQLLMFVTATKTTGAALLALGAGFKAFALTAVTAIRAVAVAMFATPIGLAITAIATLVVGAGYLIWKNWDAVKTAMVTIFNVIRDAAVTAFEGLKAVVGGVVDWLAEKTAWIFATVDKVRAAAGSVGSTVGGWWDGAKSVVGIGGSTAPAPQASAPVAAAVSAGRAGTNIRQENNQQYNITVQGGGDPESTARAVRAEMDRRERANAARQRSGMVDALGY